MEHRIKVGEIEYRAWRYRYLILFALSLFVAAIVLVDNAVGLLLVNVLGWSYAGAFIIGFFYTSSLTAPIATAAFFVATKSLDPFLAAAVGGIGAMLGDLMLFNIVRADLLPEVRLLRKDLRLPGPKDVAKEIGISRYRLGHWLKYLRSVAPFIAGFIIASPLPDELGVAMLGAMNYGSKKFLIISWFGNTLGLLVITLIAHAV